MLFNYKIDAQTHGTPTKKGATETCQAIIALVRNAVDNRDWSTERILDDIVKRERKDRPSGTPPITSDARVAEHILRGAIQGATLPLARVAGIRTDLVTAMLVGANYRDHVIGTFAGDVERATWALAALNRYRDFLWDGNDRGPVNAADVLYK